MTRIRFSLALLLGVAIAADASAQFLPVFPLPTVGQNGISFRFGGRRLHVEGFIPTGDPYPVMPFYYGYPRIAPGFPLPGYGVVEQRYTIQIINPPGLGAQAGLRQIPDLSGIDLDVEPLEKIWGPKKGGVQVAAAKNREIAPPARPKKEIEVAAAPAKPPAPPAKPEPMLEGVLFVDQGITAFKAGQYGLALLRFRQAGDVHPPGPRATFLQAHAYLAIGRYRDAAQLIQKGLQTQPEWPASAFRPKKELYDNKDDAWNAHRMALEKAHDLDKKNADPPFLLGYLAWFNGDQETAVGYFERARDLAGEARGSEVFLKMAKK